MNKHRRAWQVVMMLLGLGALVGLIAWYGFKDIGSAFAQAGWGVLWVSLFHFIPIACDAMGWRQLFRSEVRRRVGAKRLFLFRWIGESVNNLLPVGQVGGDVVRARLASKAGAPTDRAGAATVVDFTIGLLTQMFLALVALGLLAARTGLNGWVGWLLLGILVFSALIGAFLAAQIWGWFGRTGEAASRLLKGLSRRTAHQVADESEAIDERIEDVYGRRQSLALAATWRLGSWTVGSVEILLALYFLGQSVGFVRAFTIHALTMAIRSIAFIIPAGLAAQEGGFILIGQMLGLDGPTALALGLIRRVREILLGVPGLIVWWSIETRRAGRRSE